MIPEEAICVTLGIIGLITAGVFARYHGLRIWPFAILSEPVYLAIEEIRTWWSLRGMDYISAATLDRWANGEILPEEHDRFNKYMALSDEQIKAQICPRFSRRDLTQAEREYLLKQKKQLSTQKTTQ